MCPRHDWCPSADNWDETCPRAGSVVVAYCGSRVAALESLAWKGEPADSSGSETGRPEQEDDLQNETKSLAENVQFTVGGERWDGLNLYSIYSIISY